MCQIDLTVQLDTLLGDLDSCCKPPAHQGPGRSTFTPRFLSMMNCPTKCMASMSVNRHWLSGCANIVWTVTLRMQHARLPCPSLSPRVCSNSCPLRQWCNPTISSSAVPYSSCLQSFPASGSFPMSQFFTSGGQSIGVSTSASALPMNIQDWFPLGWTDWISLQSKGLSRVFSNTTVQSINSLVLSFLHSPTLTSIHDHWKNRSLD